MESPPQAGESLGLGAGELSLGMARGARGGVARMNQGHSKEEAGAPQWAEVGEGREAPEQGKGRIGGSGARARVSC